MPGGHSSETKLLGFYAKTDLVEKLDHARGGVPRSQYLRDAVVEYMCKNGVSVPPELRVAPDRKGKGGPVKYRVKRKNIETLARSAAHSHVAKQRSSKAAAPSAQKSVGAQGTPPSSGPSESH